MTSPLFALDNWIDQVMHGLAFLIPVTSAKDLRRIKAHSEARDPGSGPLLV
jgi:hypothetical protein